MYQTHFEFLVEYNCFFSRNSCWILRKIVRTVPQVLCRFGKVWMWNMEYLMVGNLLYRIICHMPMGRSTHHKTFNQQANSRARKHACWYNINRWLHSVFGRFVYFCIWMTFPASLFRTDIGHTAGNQKQNRAIRFLRIQKSRYRISFAKIAFLQMHSIWQ